MDSGDLEREKGITILAKNTAVRHGGTKINIIDTPGHADFGGEVERGLTMVDGVLLLVDASEGPLPQTRFVLRKALELLLPVILVVNKIDRPDARISEVVDEVYALFLDLDADESQIEFPDRLLERARRAGDARPRAPRRGSRAAVPDDVRHRAAAVVRGRPPAAGARDQPRRLALPRPARPLPRPQRRAPKRGDTVMRCRVDGTIERVKITDLTVTEELTRVAAEEAGPGEIIAIAGIEDVHDRRDADRPRRSAPAARDQRRRAQPLDDDRHQHVAARGARRQAADGAPGEQPPRPGAGRQRLAARARQRPPRRLGGAGPRRAAARVLVEQMRREGFELTIGKPQVVTRRIDGVLSEPVERLAIDVPEEYSGVVIGLLALRKGKMEQMVNHGTGWVRLDYLVPARGLIGFRTEFITETRGTGILHHVFEGFAPWFGDLKTRPNGSLVADRRGVATAHALMSLQERGELFIGPAVDVYEGMVIGVNARPEDLDVNACKEKKASNMRSAHAEELVRLAPPRQLSLEQALEFIREDEAVEVTPSHVRLRKVVLPAGGRTKTARAKAAAALGAE